MTTPGPVSVEQCRTCGGPTIFLDTYNGQREQFDAAEVTNPDAPDTVRWYLSRQRGAVPATVVERPKDVPFLTRHTCKLTRLGVGDKDLEAHTIAHSDSPKVPALPLSDDEDYTYSYRWPSSWAHIVQHAQTLCGARSVLQNLTDAERRRLEQMHICPKCLGTYRARMRRRGVTLPV